MPIKGKPAPENTEAIPGYTLRERIGVGGMGAVYRATQDSLGREVAVKVMSPVSACDPIQRQMFRDEALQLAELNHPNVVKAHEFGETVDGSLFYSMELIEGNTLKERIHKNDLTSRQKVNLVEQLCDAVEYLHTQGIIHRDIKPSNIILDNNGTVKVIDFGLSGHLEPGQTGIVDEEQCPIFGSPMYCAPEQFSEETEVDFRSDVYSLGVVIHELFAGSLPGSMFISQEKRVAMNCPFRELLLKALEYEPVDRQASVVEFRREFRVAAWRAVKPTAILFNRTNRSHRRNTSLANRTARGTKGNRSMVRNRPAYLRLSAATVGTAVALVSAMIALWNPTSAEPNSSSDHSTASPDAAGSFDLASNDRAGI